MPPTHAPVPELGVVSTVVKCENLFGWAHHMCKVEYKYRIRVGGMSEYG